MREQFYKLRQLFPELYQNGLIELKKNIGKIINKIIKKEKLKTLKKENKLKLLIKRTIRNVTSDS